MPSELPDGLFHGPPKIINQQVVVVVEVVATAALATKAAPSLFGSSNLVWCAKAAAFACFPRVVQSVVLSGSSSLFGAARRAHDDVIVLARLHSLRSTRQTVRSLVDHQEHVFGCVWLARRRKCWPKAALLCCIVVWRALAFAAKPATRAVPLKLVAESSQLRAQSGSSSTSPLQLADHKCRCSQTDSASYVPSGFLRFRLRGV